MCIRDRPQTYHVFIGNFHGKETADKTAEGDPEIKQRGPLCGFFRGYSFGKHKIAASTQSGRGFQGTIAKEAEQGWFGSGQLQHPGKGKRSILCSVFLCSRTGLLFFPQRKRKEKKHGEDDLNQGNGHIAAVPSFSRIQAQDVYKRQSDGYLRAGRGNEGDDRNYRAQADGL